jgi:hypothetical protein
VVEESLGLLLLQGFHDDDDDDDDEEEEEEAPLPPSPRLECTRALAWSCAQCCSQE